MREAIQPASWSALWASKRVMDAPCPSCGGRRFNRETLEILFHGKSIADVLDMTVEEGCGFFKAVPAIRDRMETLREVGLGHLLLGARGVVLALGEIGGGVELAVAGEVGASEVGPGAGGGHGVDEVRRVDLREHRAGGDALALFPIFGAALGADAGDLAVDLEAQAGLGVAADHAEERRARLLRCGGQRLRHDVADVVGERRGGVLVAAGGEEQRQGEGERDGATEVHG